MYALFGVKDHDMIIPAAWHSNAPFGTNVGGLSSTMVSINRESMYDSWLTIGIDNGDPLGQLAIVGINFDQWNDQSQFIIGDGAVFSENPNDLLSTTNRYLVAQVTVRNNKDHSIQFNIQGKRTKVIGDIWTINNLLIPFHKQTKQIPGNCIRWFDGCNTCFIQKGIVQSCTKLVCREKKDTRCITYSNGH